MTHLNFSSREILHKHKKCLIEGYTSMRYQFALDMF